MTETSTNTVGLLSCELTDNDIDIGVGYGIQLSDWLTANILVTTQYDTPAVTLTVGYRARHVAYFQCEVVKRNECHKYLATTVHASSMLNNSNNKLTLTTLSNVYHGSVLSVVANAMDTETTEHPTDNYINKLISISIMSNMVYTKLFPAKIVTKLCHH